MNLLKEVKEVQLAPTVVSLQKPVNPSDSLDFRCILGGWSLTSSFLKHQQIPKELTLPQNCGFQNSSRNEFSNDFYF